MSTYYTLQYTDEKTFADWGIALDSAVLQLQSQARSTFTARFLGGNVVADPPVPYFGQVTVRRGRVKTGGTFSGGEIIFQGRQVTDSVSASPGSQSDTLVFADAWYELENLVFQQVWNYKHDPGPLVSRTFSRLNLFQKLDTTYQNNGQQIGEIIDWAITCGVLIQKGSITPSTPLPAYPVKAVMCSEAIQMCLRPCPDAVTWLDMATVPPTFNCKRRSELTPAAVPFQDGRRHRTSSIRPRPDLKIDEVVIQYRKSTTITDSITGTSTWTDFAIDKYPPAATGQVVGAVVLPIDLLGGTTVRLSAQLSAAALVTTAAGWKAWFVSKKPELSDVRVSSLSMLTAAASVSVTDASGNPVSLASYPNELLDGNVATWMNTGAPPAPVNAVPVTVSADFTWTEKDAGGTVTQKTHSPARISVRTKLTNSPTGVLTYSLDQSVDLGEFAPVGLAQYIWTSMNPLAFEGSHTMVDLDTPTIVGPYNTLNITGGKAEWATMAATVQSARYTLGRGETDIEFGPPKHLSPGDLADLLIHARFRFVWENPAVRSTGQSSGSAGGELGKNTPKENTTHGLSALTYLSVNDSPSSPAAQIQLDPAAIIALGVTNKTMKPRLIVFKDATDCTNKQFCVLATQPE